VLGIVLFGGDLQLLKCCSQLGYLFQISETFVPARSFRERPEIRQYISVDTTTLIRDPDYDVLSSVTDEHFDRRRFFGRSHAYNSLCRVSKQFANDVLDMGRDVRKSGVQITVNVNIRNGNIGAICFAC